MGRIAVLLHPDSELEVRQRIFQLMGLIAGFFAVAVITPCDLLEHLPLLLSGGVFLFGLAFLGMFWLANRRGIYMYKFSSMLIIALLNFAWFFNGGSQGPTQMVFFSAAIVYTVIFVGMTRWIFLSFFILNVSSLYYLEYSFPKLVTGYASQVVRLQDFLLTVPAAIIMCVLMVLAVLGAHDADRQGLAQSKTELEARLAELRVLKGLLPVCAACKKIRSKDGVWEQMEVYIEQHSHASFSHGLCPECMPLYMGLDDDN
jgi:hypothetical protein